MKKKKVLMLFVLVIIIAGIFIGVKLINDLNAYKAQVDAISISDVDLSKIEDGVYTGYYDAKLVSAKVRVTVKNHRIESIELTEHNNGRGKPAEIIPDKVVEAQSLDVDTVSGATSSSKVILKAIENALNSASQ
ncbi:MAG TPA: FMN-binding protein [Thermoclostridium sp.]|nr:FMN-binding protein [Thermoclostridium sp.]